MKRIKQKYLKLLCFLGFHKWYKYIPSERVCQHCKVKERFVVYPFSSPNWRRWERFKSEKEWKEESWLKYYEGKLEYVGDDCNWHPYKPEYVNYLYPKQLRGEM